jgi:nitrate reductase NapAB chaperone NapD
MHGQWPDTAWRCAEPQTGAMPQTPSNKDPRIVMPVCSYVVIPEPGATQAVQERLASLPGCETVRAENREVILLVTDTAGAEQEEQLRRQVQATPGILTVVLAFGDLEDEASLVQLGARRTGGAV